MTLIAGVLENVQCKYTLEYVDFLKRVQYGLCEDDCEDDLYRLYNQLKGLDGNTDVYVLDSLLVSDSNDEIVTESPIVVSATELQFELQFELG